MNSFHSPWMDWEPKKESGSAVSTVSSLTKQKGKNSMPDEGSVSTVSSIDKQKMKILCAGESGVSTVSSLTKQKDKISMPGKSAVSSVSSSDKDLPDNKKDLKMLFYRTDSTDTTQKNPNLTIQRTDTTDSTPRILDGHVVVRIIWETDKAIVFIDDLGRFWRFLHAYGQAWPVIVG